jgi:NADPH:quinone reductase-like Zn-dependent oxidoreductase
MSAKCWFVRDIGDPSDPTIIKLHNRNLPAIGSDKVLVEVKAAALNPIDYHLALGHFKLVSQPPFVPGHDFAGEVLEAPEGSNFKPGDRVFGDSLDAGGSADGSLLGGSLAEKMVVPLNDVALMPSTMSFTEAAALPLVSQTVLDCINAAGVPAPATVIVVGASGGVGSHGVQILKAKGYKVIAVASGKNEKNLRDLGADEFVDYKTQSWEQIYATEPRTVDAVLDWAPVGSKETFEKALQVLKDNSRCVSLDFIPGLKDERFVFVYRKTTPVKLTELTRMVDAGKLKPIIDTVYPFADVPKAFKHLQGHSAQGKIIIDVTK